MHDRAQLLYALKKINRCEKPATTLRVWNAIIGLFELESGRISVTPSVIAAEAEVTPNEVRRALTVLADLDILIREARGRYKVNDQIVWTGFMRPSNVVPLKPRETA
jgi:DNA-binding IclR family transcriptional regulator